MVLAVGVLEPLGGYVGIDFGGADAGMAEHFLDDAQIRIML